MSLAVPQGSETASHLGSDAAVLRTDNGQASVVIECPAWCERGQEHVGADDIGHWTRDRRIDGSTLTATLINEGGCDLFEIHLGECATLQLQAHQASKLISVLAELMALSAKRWKETTILTVDDEDTAS